MPLLSFNNILIICIAILPFWWFILIKYTMNHSLLNFDISIYKNSLILASHFYALTLLYKKSAPLSECRFVKLNLKIIYITAAVFDIRASNILVTIKFL